LRWLCFALGHRLSLGDHMESLTIGNAEYLTIGDAAEIAKMSTRTVRRAISRGEIPAYRVGGGLRIVREDVHAWITSRPLTTIERR